MRTFFNYLNRITFYISLLAIIIAVVWLFVVIWTETLDLLPFKLLATGIIVCLITYYIDERIF